MLTTVTPAAQVLSIAEQRREPAEARAVADRGRHGDHRARSTSPPTTDGSAPSMPATTMITLGGLELRALARAAGGCPATPDVVAAARRGCPPAARSAPPPRPPADRSCPPTPPARCRARCPRSAAARRRSARASFVVPRRRHLAQHRLGACASATRVARTLAPPCAPARPGWPDLLGGLAEAEHHLGEAGAQVAMMIDAREAEILVRQVGQLAQRLVDGGVAGAHALEQSLRSCFGSIAPSLVENRQLRVRPARPRSGRRPRAGRDGRPPGAGSAPAS